ncbi:hypothetical protein BJF93_15485 [Xaviernesmea oryzae]|uniref:Divergent polysaccharide deacetylase family protein n=1 Tax=Xaviernesmea oryzae TaxID=464029 RepID=A0A1Q9AY29_9HYPH|nr:divergent polysaccharide deacetylase family protein [Xaviernesmea oryzae]OLP60353.1 hypothetical protein BJF93_15485 [Xaviernesmea oryzae]SEK21920.1 hypothetical protein SAMN04487976_101119 [Xaviernesmea oryzae]
MATDLHAPLGQNRPPQRQRRKILTLNRLGGALAVLILVGGSAYVALERQAGLMDKAAMPVEQAEKPAPPVLPQAAPPAKRADGIAQTTNPDGSVVTKFTPRQTSAGGPALISVGPSGTQDPRMAATPNPELYEDTPDGRLPIIAANGTRPMAFYARPWSGARGTRIALVVGGLGLSQTGTDRAIRLLDPAVTLALAASGNSLMRWAQDARRSGHEILLQLPMEPFDYPANDPGPRTLKTRASAEANLASLHRAMGSITNYTGVMNFLGGRFLSNADALEPVLRETGQRGLLFLDDGTSAQSLTGTLADALSVPHAFGDLVIDGDINRQAILKKLDELERIARRNGTAIGTASAFDESIDAIAQWMREAEARGIEFVGVSALAKDPAKP